MRAGPAGIIKGILALQMAMGAWLVVSDMSADWQGLAIGPRAPGMTEPVRPGDQTRRYRPRDLPADAPGRPFPMTGDMPARLTLIEVDHEGARVLRMVGTVAPGDAARLEGDLTARLDGDDPPAAILLHSPGGSVTDALDLGRLLRGLQASVAVVAGDVCLSACPYILAGGADRAVDPDGSVGVHQHYFGENSVQPAFMAVEDIQRGQGMVMAYLDEMGIDPRIMQKALVTPPDEIYILLPEEMERFDLVGGA